MSFRSRLLVLFSATTLLLLAILALGVRRQLTTRLTAQYERRAAALARVAEQDLERESAATATRLATLARAIAQDNALRLAAVYGDPGQRSYLLDYAEQAMRLTGLSLLQLQDEAGRILSSGHFRNEFDRLEPELPRLLATSPKGVAIVRARAPEGAFLALARVDSIRLGNHRFTLVGGVALDERMLRRFARDGELAVSLVTPGGTIPTDTTSSATDAPVTAEVALPYIDAAADPPRLATARLAITYSLAELGTVRRDVDRWFVAALMAAIVGTIALAAMLSARLGRPLAQLAQAASVVDLDGPDVDLVSGRDDEIGTLARRMGAMTRRIRTSAMKLRDAERRATVGEMARQVNHDIKNGLIHIRNVLRHLAEVQEREPSELPSVFAERRSTLESSVGYLDALARSYARLSPRPSLRPLDANAIAGEVARTASAGSATVQTRLADALPPVLADPVVLRRILDNVVRNALESLDSGSGTVTLQTAPGAGSAVRFVVTDSGRGMTEEQLSRAFDDFYTTKEGGTGLGLSVVRRLTTDLEGSLRVESAPGQGTTVTIELPAAASRRAPTSP